MLDNIVSFPQPEKLPLFYSQISVGRKGSQEEGHRAAFGDKKQSGRLDRGAGSEVQEFWDQITKPS